MAELVMNWNMEVMSGRSTTKSFQYQMKNILKAL